MIAQLIEEGSYEQGCSRSIDLGGKDQDHLIELDLLWWSSHHQWTCKNDLDLDLF